MLPKFRIWDKEEKHMKTFLSSVGHLVGAILTEQMRGESNSVVKPNYSKYVVMMGTGKRDKNGKEIFEGDIVENVLQDKGVVKYSKNKCCFYLDVRNCGNWYSVSLRIDDLRVIGNIFENPELLKEVKDDD